MLHQASIVSFQAVYLSSGTCRGTAMTPGCPSVTSDLLSVLQALPVRQRTSVLLWTVRMNPIRGGHDLFVFVTNMFVCWCVCLQGRCSRSLRLCPETPWSWILRGSFRFFPSGSTSRTTTPSRPCCGVSLVCGVLGVHCVKAGSLPPW